MTLWLLGVFTIPAIVIAAVVLLIIVAAAHEVWRYDVAPWLKSRRERRRP